MAGQPAQVPPSAHNDHDSHRPYTISVYARYIRKHWQALVDRGANGIIVGNDMRLIAHSGGSVNLNGLDDHTVRDLPLVQAGAYVLTNLGPRILIVNQGAYMPDGKTIISAGQLEHFGWTVHDKSPRITSHDAYCESPEGVRIPFSFKGGLPFMALRPFTDDEWTTLPHIMASSPHPWDPTCLDVHVEDSWYSAQPTSSPYILESDYDEFGQLKPDRLATMADTDDETMIYPTTRAHVATYCTQLVSPELNTARHAFVQTRAQRKRHHRARARPSTSDHHTLARSDQRSSRSDHRALARSDQRPSRSDLSRSDLSDQRQSRSDQHTLARSDQRAMANPSTNPSHLPTASREGEIGLDSRSPVLVETVVDGETTDSTAPPPMIPRSIPTGYSSSSDDDRLSSDYDTDVPALSRDDLAANSSSSESDSDDDTAPPLKLAADPRTTSPTTAKFPSPSRVKSRVATPGKASYNSPAKEATGIDYPSKRWKLKSPSRRDAKRLKKFFPGASTETIKRTLEATTQYGTRGAVEGTTLRQQVQAPNPVLNIPRRNEDVATDTLYSDTPAIDDGSTACQFFIGTLSKFRSVAPLGKSDKNFPKALMDEIRKRGAMNRIISDSAKAELSERVKDILRTFAIDEWSSEARQQRQNPAERGWGDSKAWTNNVLNISGAPPSCWLEALRYVIFLQNHTAYKSLGWRTPTEWLLGYTPDISVLLQFIFFEPVFYAKYEPSFPSDSTELIGRFVGIAENVGHPMTYRILTENGTIINRAVVRSALKSGPFRNLRANPEPQIEEDETDDPDVLEFRKQFRDSAEADPEVQKFRDGVDQEIIRSRSGLDEDKLPIIDIKGLLGRTFITNPNDEGEQHRAKVLEMHPTGETTADGKDAILRFKCQHGDRMFEEVMSYNKMLEWCDRDLHKDDMYKIDAVIGHRKAKLSTTRGQWEVLVQWASGQTSWNCLNLIYSDDPVTISMYAIKNNLLNTVGWKRCKTHAKNMKKFGRMINQAKLRNYRRRPVYKYGYQVPRNHEEAVFIDEKNGNTKWQDSEKLELKQVNDYKAFRDLGLGAPIPEGYQKIPCHIVYDVKYDGRHKSRFVAGGHRTSTPTSSVYSGVVSLQGIRLVTFLAELNDLELWGTDVGNAYLESYTTEKVCFIAGEEFGELAGHTMMIVKALYGLKSSGRCWHDRLFEVLQAMGFSPSKAEPDIWMRPAGDHYEYVASYVDDLLIGSRNPQAIIDALEGKPNNFILKGTGEVKFHLGCDFFRDETGTLCFGPKTYIERLALQYKSLFGEMPSTKVTSPLEKNDHPELDTSPLLDEDGVTHYQSLIGALQWVITLGRFDIAVAVMTMSSFRVAPRVGHLDRLKRIVGYLLKMKHGFIRVRTDEPDYSDLQPKHYDWSHTVYGNVNEMEPSDAPKPLGKPVVTTSHVDANLYHDWVSGRAVSGILHFANQTPFDWYTKKQATVETATYGSEFVAAKTATQQIIGIRTTLRYLGVPVKGETRLFGDNGSVVTSASTPHSPLKKRHHALSYHYTREAIAARVLDFQHLPGELNPADILSKHWGYSQVWPILRSVLFWAGDTADLLGKDASESSSGVASPPAPVDA